MNAAALGAIVCAACASAAPRPAPQNRVATGAAAAQRLGLLGIGELGPCKVPHRVAITLDGVPRSALLLPCEPEPKPNASGVIVTTTDSAPEIAGAPIDVPPGHHVLTAHDEITGLTQAVEGDFPMHDPNASLHATAPLADVLFVLVHEDWIQLGVGVRANLIRL